MGTHHVPHKELTIELGQSPRALLNFDPWYPRHPRLIYFLLLSCSALERIQTGAHALLFRRIEIRRNGGKTGFRRPQQP